MDSPFFATPVARQGPTSRLLRRRSEKPPPQPDLEVTRLDSTMAAAGRRTANVSFAVPLSTSRLGATMMTDRNDTSGVELTMFPAFSGHEMTMNQTLRFGDAFPQLQTTENLFVDFLSTISVESVGIDALDQVAEMEEMVTIQVNGLKPTKTINADVKKVVTNLNDEKNTWRLIGKLYHDRLTYADGNMSAAMETDELPLVVLQNSEKCVIDKLFERDANLRQAQIVIDWLEQNARDESENDIHLEYFSDALVAWENTLACLNGTSRSTGRALVRNMDPDAPRRLRLPLHDQDAQDEHELLKALFLLIRSGQLDKAQQLCIKVGQPWRAATMEGWKLFHDPNYERDMGEEKLPVEGNKNRDLWKSAVWKMTQDERIPVVERAIYSCLVGNVSQLLAASCKTWNDFLWAYTKGFVDCYVEGEIRDACPRMYASLPKEYWENKRSVAAIFDAIAASPDATVRREASSPYHVVQKCFITQNFDDLFAKMDDWLMTDEYRNDPHLLRFLAHVVLIIRKLVDNPELTSEDQGSNVIKAYASYLMETNHVQQVAWYVSQLPHSSQISMYAEFLETVYVESDRRLALTLAIESNLPISDIKSQVVKNIFNLELPEDETGNEEKLNLLDRRKIDAIRWLLFDPHQRSEAMSQTNALTRSFIASGKYNVAKDTWLQLPEDSAQIVTNFSVAEHNGVVSAADSNIINEYICWKAYFRAQDSFSDWFEHYHRKKPQPPALPENPTFTEKVAYEQRFKQYQRDVERWQAAQALQAGDACNSLTEVVTFSGGWLLDQVSQDEIDPQRAQEVDYLRRLCIPQLMLLLHSVLHATEQYSKAIALADIVASEQYALYEVYHQENLREFLMKVRESSLAAMETGKKDSLGWTVDDDL